jgi:hypothetical protein
MINKNFCFGFFGTSILCAIIAWLGGYNFDTRGPEIANWVSFVFWISVMVGGVTATTAS